MNIHVDLLAKVSLVLFIIVFLAHFYTGLVTFPSEGDSLAYHFPIANRLLEGGILNPQTQHQYYPSNGEVILALFLFFSIPPNLYNVAATLLLLIAARHLARNVGLTNPLSLLFATTLCLLQLTLRWTMTQTIDIWMAVFFTFALSLLHKPNNSGRYYLKLGLAIGLMMGTKSSAPFFIVVMYLVYFKNFARYLTLKYLFYHMIPILFFGVFWYGRNLWLTGNPFYPQNLWFLRGIPGWNILEWQMWKMVFLAPLKLFNAGFSEYLIWFFSLLTPLLAYLKLKHQLLSPKERTLLNLLLLGIGNLIVFALSPTTLEYSIIISSFRYSYPVFIPLILAAFLLAHRFNWEKPLALVILATQLIPQLPVYRPKLLFLFLPLLIVYAVKQSKSIIK